MPYNKADFDRLDGFEAGRLKTLKDRTELYSQQNQLQQQIGSLIGRAKAKKGPVSGNKLSSDVNGIKQEQSTMTANGEADSTTTANGEASSNLGSEGKLGDSSSDVMLATLQSKARLVREQIKANHDAWNKEWDWYSAFTLTWPNSCHPNVPVGPEGNAVVVSVQDPFNVLPSMFDSVKKRVANSTIQLKTFPNSLRIDPSKDHLTLSSSLKQGEIDMDSGTLATGSSWPYLLGSLSLLEHALTQYALSMAVQHGFIPVSPPDVVKMDLAERCGFQPRDVNAKQTYKLSDSSELCLAATAEIPLAGLLASRTFTRRSAKGGHGSMIERSELPIKLVAMGHAFRAEAGARGADTRGLYRVHQFTKVEMFVLTEPDAEESNKMLWSLLGIQEEIVGGLGLAYRVLDMPTEELGASATRKFDIEVWMPGRGTWGEVSSASNCTSYQAKRLNIKLANLANQQTIAAHTLNATAAAIPRLIVSILETHGVQDGKLKLPDTLLPFWLGGANDPNVVWLATKPKEKRATELEEKHATKPKEKRATELEEKHASKPGLASKPGEKQSRFNLALEQVRASAHRNGTTPTTMAASFLILHELTAIVPLFVLFYLFGALGVGIVIAQWLLGDDAKPSDYGLVRRFQAWVRLKEVKLESYCRRKGWLGFDKQGAGKESPELGQSNIITGSFANMLAAYLIVKIILPVRIGFSIALAGRFARSVLEPAKRAARRLSQPF